MTFPGRLIYALSPCGLNGVGGHSWELGPVPIPNTEVNLPGDLGGSVVREPMRTLDRCQLRCSLAGSGYAVAGIAQASL